MAACEADAAERNDEPGQRVDIHVAPASRSRTECFDSKCGGSMLQGVAFEQALCFGSEARASCKCWACILLLKAIGHVQEGEVRWVRVST